MTEKNTKKSTEKNEDSIKDIGKARYQVKRDHGISPVRKDGSECSADNDIESTCAENFAARSLGLTFNDSVTLHGDGGYDFVMKLTVEVIWLGKDKKTGKPRRDGHLIVNPNEPHRWADIYLVVAGSVNEGFEIMGWTTHRKLLTFPKKNFGFGEKFCMPTSLLYLGSSLVSLRKDAIPGQTSTEVIDSDSADLL